MTGPARFLHTLTDEQRERCITLRNEGHLYREIAEIVGCSTSAAENICNGRYYRKPSPDGKPRTEIRPHIAGPDITMDLLMTGRVRRRVAATVP